MNTNATTPSPSAVTQPRSIPPKSLDDLIAEQRIGPLKRFEDLFGAGRDLWTDEEFADFLAQLQATRHEKD